MADHKIFKVEEYTLKDGDTFDSIVAGKGVTVKQLKQFNFGTEDDSEIKKYHWGRLHCSKLNDNGSFKFVSGDTPGKIFIPKLSEPALTFASNGTHEIKLKSPKLDVLKPAKCIVKFRPGGGWDGAYGFDFMREADTGARGDLKYEDNMANATQVTSLHTKYKQFDILEAKDDDTAAKTTAAYLNLYPADDCSTKPHTATIKMKLDQRGSVPAKLKVECTLATYKDHIEIPEELPKTNGDHDITVKCKKACSQDIELNIVSYTNDKKGKDHHVTVGKLIIPKNDLPNRPKCKVVFVTVATNVNGTRKTTAATYINRMATLLEKYCDQVVIHLEVGRKTFDMTVGRAFTAGIKIKKFFGRTLTDVEVFNKDWVVESPVGDGTRVILTDTYKRRHLTGGRIMVHEVLSASFKKKFPEYKEFYPIFMFDEEGFAIDAPTPPATDDDYVGLNGVADAAPGNSVLVFGTQSDSTVSHELFHALGLHHPFDSSSALHFKNHGTGGETYCKTDNIMDYSHFVKPPIPMFQTWHWQWAIMKNALKTKVWP